jgi:hypothetical protein
MILQTLDTEEDDHPGVCMTFARRGTTGPLSVPSHSDSCITEREEHRLPRMLVTCFLSILSRMRTTHTERSIEDCDCRSPPRWTKLPDRQNETGELKQLQWKHRTRCGYCPSATIRQPGCVRCEESIPFLLILSFARRCKPGRCGEPILADTATK